MNPPATWTNASCRPALEEEQADSIVHEGTSGIPSPPLMSGPTCAWCSAIPKQLETNVYPMSFGESPEASIAARETRVAASRPVSFILPKRFDAAPTTQVSRTVPPVIAGGKDP
jgi:hypothetical protein